MERLSVSVSFPFLPFLMTMDNLNMTLPKTKRLTMAHNMESHLVS